ncbi:MAG: hypothetical protein JW882_03905 [Deltaproteobacteria bacterium]|nr:hypothetical protein [Deltaproteobacteria bacterium]
MTDYKVGDSVEYKGKKYKIKSLKEGKCLLVNYPFAVPVKELKALNNE